MRNILLLVSVLAISACSSTRDVKIETQTRFVCPQIKSYSPETQKKAKDELEVSCANSPTICMMIGDYLAMRDAGRVCSKQKISNGWSGAVESLPKVGG